jgi:hypothetical protein
MPITDYIGTEGFCVKAESAQDVYDAIDLMHTQILDEFGEDSPILRVLERAMDSLLDMESVGA